MWNRPSKKQLPKLTPGDIYNLFTKKAPGQDGFISEFCQTWNTNSVKIFQKIQEEGKLPILFFEASITLRPKLDKDVIRKESNRPVHHKHKCKNYKQNFSN